MKFFYNILLILLTTSFCFSQGYDLAIIDNGNYNYKVVAIPDFDSAVNTNNLDSGFTLMLPAGTVDVANQVGLLGGRTWDVTEYNAAQLVAAGGDGTQDAFQFNLPAGSTIFSHTNGQMIDLVSFDVINTPTSGTMEFLDNGSALAMTAGIFDSFYQTDLDGPGGDPTQDYFSGYPIGMESVLFTTLGASENILTDVSVSIYPNPTSDVINIESAIVIDSVEMFDLLGKQVLNADYTEQIKVGYLPTGVYLLKVYSEKGNLTKKIIIE